MALNVLRREVIKVITVHVRNTGNSSLASLPACNAAFRHLHVSSCSHGQKKGSLKSKGRESTKGNERQVSEEMKTAVNDVAQSLGGNWTKTAEELLARLASHHEPPATTSVTNDEGKTAPPISLLNTMAVGKSFSDVKGDRTAESDKGGSVSQRRRMPVESFTSIFSGERLGIFDAEAVKGELSKKDQAQPEDLWHAVDQENLRMQQGSVHSNAFDEMAQWTRAGKMWRFPVDNEEDMHEERQYQFYDHIFLDKHLGEFPDQGPIRKFMELVVIGLSSNPWLSVPEKIGHIQWYAEYFKEKEDILVASIREQGKMKTKRGDAADAQ